MIDIDTFVVTVYVMVDDFSKFYPVSSSHRGPDPALSRSEAVTLALIGQWGRFLSERAFYRWARKHLKWAFPRLPHRSQLNRQIRDEHDMINAFSLSLVEQMQARTCVYEILDGSGVPTRDAKRRGNGWLPGMADIGWSNRIGWYEGFELLVSITPIGVITGFGFAAASTHELLVADTFFAARAYPHPDLPTVGQPALGPYISDKGVLGQDYQQGWKEAYEVDIIHPPKRNSKNPWSKRLRRWLAGRRQVVESVYSHLHHTFRLLRERPHQLSGFRSEMVLLMMAGYIGTIASPLLSVLMIFLGIDLGSLPSWSVLVMLVWFIPLVGQIGMNPILAVALITPVLPEAATLGVSPTSLVVALTAGWILSGVSSPFTATTTGLEKWRFPTAYLILNPAITQRSLTMVSILTNILQPT